MGIEVQKRAPPTLFHFARARAASQPHVVFKVALLSGFYQTLKGWYIYQKGEEAYEIPDETSYENLFRHKKAS